MGLTLNPRSPCGERLLGQRQPLWAKLFQPTLPVRGATFGGSPSPAWLPYFNPRSPCGERLLGDADQLDEVLISTHAPRAGSDVRYAGGDLAGRISTHAPRAGSDRDWSKAGAAWCGFQPTLPVRGATWPGWMPTPSTWNFNPRSPCGERPNHSQHVTCLLYTSPSPRD